MRRYNEERKTKTFIVIALVGGIIAGLASEWLVIVLLDSSQLYIIGTPAHVGVGKITNVTFITFSNGEAVGNASVFLDGAAASIGITGINGMLTLPVNATSNGSINITASKAGYRNATSGMTAIPGLELSASPTSLTSNISSFVTLTVTSVGKPVSGVSVNLSGAGISIDGFTNTNGQLVLQLNPPITGIISATAEKEDYTEGVTAITSTSQQILSVSSSQNMVTANVPVFVTFTVSAGNSPVSDAEVSLSGVAAGNGITNQDGKAIILVTPSAAGVISVSATRTGYAGGSEIISSTGTQALSVTSTPTTITAGVPAFVSFYVASGTAPVSESTVTLTGVAGGSGITNQNGQVILLVNATSAGAITATAAKNGFSAGSAALSATAQQSLSIVANPYNLTNGAATYVTFTVTSAGAVISGAAVSVSGGGIGMDGVTNSAGQVTLLLNAAPSGAISAMARKAGFIDGFTTIAH